MNQATLEWGRFVVSLNTGRFTKEGEILGPFGIDSRPHHLQKRCWWVTHRPTGMAIMGCLRSRSAAVKLCRKLLDLGLNWEFTCPQAVKTQKWQAVKPVLDEFMCKYQFCEIPSPTFLEGGIAHEPPFQDQ